MVVSILLPIVLPFLLLLVVICLLDADLITSLMEKCGKKPAAVLNGKVIWITGASTGIGAALAKQAAKLGCKLILTARNKERLEQVRTECVKAGAAESNILLIPMDMCDLQEHQGAYQKVLDKFGTLDVMLHNAGRSQRARWECTDIGVDMELFQLNVFSVIHLTRIVLPDMLKKKSGTIAVMSSVAGKAGAPFSGTYTGSKHALHGYFEALRNEKVGSGVAITMLCPGPVFSNLLQIAATEKPSEQFGQDMTPSDRRMTAERCAELSLIAIANKVSESWICFFPVLPLMYAKQYLPSLAVAAMEFLGSSFLLKLRDSRNTLESNKEK